LSLESALNNQLEHKPTDYLVRPLSQRNWFSLGQLVWSPDGKGLLFDASERTLDYPSQLWFISYSDGEVARITNDLTDYRDISISSDWTIVTAQQQSMSSTWVVPTDNFSGGRPTISGSGASSMLRDITWTMDNRIIYAAVNNVKEDLWIMTAMEVTKRNLHGTVEITGRHSRQGTAAPSCSCPIAPEKLNCGPWIWTEGTQRRSDHSTGVLGHRLFHRMQSGSSRDR
jgi:hypothetical protein